MKLPKEDFIDKELEIHYESMFTLEKELRNHPKTEAKFHKWYSQANKELGDANLELEIVTSIIADEICNSENISSSARSEVRRSRVAGDKRYQEAFRKVIKAQEAVDYMSGLTKSIASKGYRLKELVYLSSRLLWNEPSSFSNKDYSKMDLSDSMDIER